jgi:hypothetical protein
VIHYRWHPLFGEKLQVHRSHRLPDGARVYFCPLPNGTLGAIPAWMSDRERCVGCELSSAPEVSIEALEELRIILAELSRLPPPTTIRIRRTPVRGEVRKDAEEKAGDPTRIGTDTPRVLARAARSKSGPGHRAAHATITAGGAGQAQRQGDDR